jgi:uncharacterized DUF497 family protein
MKIEFDPIKRSQTLLHRSLDFADCQRAFEGVTYTFEDIRKGYGETRFITWALMRSRLVVIVWTPRGAVRRIISLRKANERETALFNQALERPG